MGKKHEIYIDGEKIIVKGDFISQGIADGISPYNLAEYESCQVYIEGYRQMYNKCIEEGHQADADHYGKLMQDKFTEIRNLKG